MAVGFNPSDPKKWYLHLEALEGPRKNSHLVDSATGLDDQLPWSFQSDHISVQGLDKRLVVGL